eukprot:10843045-Heterocapsa_arctica.AAC.1
MQLIAGALDFKPPKVPNAATLSEWQTTARRVSFQRGSHSLIAMSSASASTVAWTRDSPMT